MHIQTILALLYASVLLAVSGFAFVRGGRPERVGAALNLSAAFASGLARASSIASWAPAETIILLIDLSITAGFFWLAISTTRFWPVWAFGFALANLFCSLAGGLMPGIVLFAYSSGLVLYAYLALGALAIGTFRLPQDANPVLRHGSRRLWQQHQNENENRTKT